MNIYVGNLSYGTTEENLRTEFSAYGEVTAARIVTDRDSGRSKGFGFVEMADQAAGEKAIAELNGKEVDGRSLKVNPAKPKEERSSGSRGGYSGRNNRY